MVIKGGCEGYSALAYLRRRRSLSRSPDGTHLLAQSDDHHVDVFQLKVHESSHDLIEVFSIRAPTTLLAVEWYPFAQYNDPASWCLVMSARDVPIRLIDAYQGTVSTPQ
jgi:hypothetical protein